jgi:hypothetical protein
VTIASSAAALGLVLAGCNASALTKRELVVYFTPDATQSQHLAALDACAHVTPEATPEPFSTTGPAADTVGNVRFRIDHADDKALAELETCLSKQPGVQGADIPDLTD